MYEFWILGFAAMILLALAIPRLVRGDWLWGGILIAPVIALAIFAIRMRRG